MKFRTLYHDEGKPEGLSFSGVLNMAQQSFRDESDVNHLVRRYVKTGVYYDRPGLRVPQYGDYSSGEDYRDIQDRLLSAQNAFASLPAETRFLHGNDPARFLDWLSDPENWAEAADLGILDPASLPSSSEDSDLSEPPVSDPPISDPERQPDADFGSSGQSLT